MNGSQFTEHARVRMQQRGVTTDLLQLLDAYGVTQHDHHGAKLRYFNKASRRRLLSVEGRDVFRRVESKLGVYAVIASDGGVITVGHRDQRIRRH